MTQKSFWKKAKHAAHNYQNLPKGKPLAGFADGSNMVYAHNPFYLEIGQGANSPMRGVGAIAMLGFIGAGVYILYVAFLIGDISKILGGGVALLFAFAVFGPLLYVNFFAPVDLLVRFDHKRQKVWIWTARGPIEIDWQNLTPRVEERMINVYGSKVHFGQYVELGPDGEPLKTLHMQHQFTCGEMGDGNTVRQQMEYIRLYMEKGPTATPVLEDKHLLHYRPKWYAMINIIGTADDWVAWKNGDNLNRPSIALTLFFILFFPIFFPLQVTNWLALWVAPIPKWGKDITEMHAADLAALNEAVEKGQTSKPKRKPVIRINGEIVDTEK